MEPKFQTSFIPKKPVDSSPKDYLYTSPHRSIFSVIIWILFILVLIVCGGLFIYKRILNNEIASIDKEISVVREQLELETIEEIIKNNSQIEAANKILNEHLVIYPLFEQLEMNVLRNIGFTNLNYVNNNKQITIKSDIISKNYNSLAQQSIKFKENEYMINPSFQNFTLTEDGNISAVFNSLIDGSLLSYKRVVNEQNTNQ